MNSTQSQSQPQSRSQPIPAQLKVVFTLARLLERLDGSTEPVGADQYRSVVSHLSEELQKVRMDDMLQALLNAHPAAAELYENLNYQHAGLCRSPLEASLNAELAAREALVRAAKPRASEARG